MIRKQSPPPYSDEDPAEARPAAAGPPAAFAEEEFFRRLKALSDAGNHAAAMKHYMDGLASIAGSKLGIKERFNHALFAAQLVQAGGSTKHGYRKLLRKYLSIESHLAGLGPLPSGAFVELGCGTHDPLSLASCFFLNGHEPAFGIDMQPPRNECYSALSMYEVLANMHAFPRRYCRNAAAIPEFRKRLNRFDLAAFERGDFRGGFRRLADKIRLEQADVVDSSITPSSVSLLVSFAVLEHVHDVAGVCRRLFEMLKPGGVVLHFVDLADHRSYRGDGDYSCFTFLTEEQPPRFLNRLRAPEITAAHLAAGFEIIKDTRFTRPMPDAEQERLLPRFKAMPLQDVCAIRQHLTLRKPLVP